MLKQQGHSLDLSVIAYSPNGKFIASGGEDGKVKVWTSSNGFCFVTFTEHKGAITGLSFSPNGQALFSSSLDGTVRAFDLTRYRNFRTMVPMIPTQFSCLAVDPSGELVVAGSSDTFDICVWSVQTGKLLDVLKGHEGPVVSLAFSQTRVSHFLSCSP